RARLSHEHDWLVGRIRADGDTPANRRSDQRMDARNRIQSGGKGVSRQYRERSMVGFARGRAGILTRADSAVGRLGPRSKYRCARVTTESPDQAIAVRSSDS